MAWSRSALERKSRKRFDRMMRRIFFFVESPQWEAMRNTIRKKKTRSFILVWSRDQVSLKKARHREFRSFRKTLREITDSRGNESGKSVRKAKLGTCLGTGFGQIRFKDVKRVVILWIHAALTTADIGVN